jgi:ABC-2 type transport system ATP-binding protein
MTSSISNDAISLTGVSKIFRTGIFKKKVGVKDLTFSVAPGEVVGLLGANGSGKSTTIKMILGFLKPTEGNILVCGHGANERIARKFIGYLPENPRFQKFLTAGQLMQYFGQLSGLGKKKAQEESDRLLELVHLKHVAKERIQGFSKGMTQRLAIAQSLLNNPQLLIFDEPMSGLDPVGRKEVRQLISRVHAEFPKATLFFSTHILADVEQLCSSAILLRASRLTQQSRLDDLLVSASLRYELQVKGLPSQVKSKYLAKPGARPSEAGILFNIDGTSELIGCLSEIDKSGGHIISIDTHRKSLEEALFKDQNL